MFRQVTRKPKYSIFKKAIIVLHIILSALIVLTPMVWLSNKIQDSWGPEAAIVVLTLTFIEVVVIVAGGMGIGLCIDYAIRRRKFIFRSPQPGNWVERTIKMWGYNVTAQLEKKEESIVSLSEVNDTIPIVGTPIPEKAKRRGRKPVFPITRWMEVALIWELRDPIFDAFSLSDVIAQKLGTATNGEPIIGDGAYYATWRIPAIQEINRLGLTSRPLSENLPDNEKLE